MVCCRMNLRLAVRHLVERREVASDQWMFLTLWRSLLGAGALSIALLIIPNGGTAQSRPDQNRIYQAQGKLFEGNFLGRLPNGVFDDRTSKALAAWQKQGKRPQTGVLTDKEFDRLMRFDPGKHAWEAISGSTDGSWAAVWGVGSGVEAARKALASCRKKSSRPDDCSYVSNSVDRGGPGWSAAVFC